MIGVLAKREYGLRIVHINAQSLSKNLDESRHLSEKSDSDIIQVSETWFYIDLSDILLNGNKVFCSDNLTHVGRISIPA